MILDLSAVVNAEGKKLAFDTKLDCQDAGDLGIEFSQPVSVTGNVVNIGGSLELSANVKTVLRCVCNRCCDEFCEEFECSFEEVLKKEVERPIAKKVILPKKEETKIEELGGIFVDSVTKKTEILFAGDKAGSKLKKAQELNIIIYDESKLIELLEEN